MDDTGAAPTGSACMAGGVRDRRGGRSRRAARLRRPRALLGNSSPMSARRRGSCFALGAPRWSLEPGRVAMAASRNASVVVARDDDRRAFRPALFVLRRDAVGKVGTDWHRARQGRCARSMTRVQHPRGSEARTVLKNIDFDTSCLLHETGIPASGSASGRCYLGREVVAWSRLDRSERLVGLASSGDALPVAGTHAHLRRGRGPRGYPRRAVAPITSTISPML